MAVPPLYPEKPLGEQALKRGGRCGMAPWWRVKMEEEEEQL